MEPTKAHDLPRLSLEASWITTSRPFLSELTIFPSGLSLTFNGVPVGSVTLQTNAARTGTPFPKTIKELSTEHTDNAMFIL